MKKLVLFVATVVAVALAACTNEAEETEATEEVEVEAVEAPAEETIIDTIAAVADSAATVVEEVVAE